MIEFNHFNFNVLNLEKSIAFYKEAIGLSVCVISSHNKMEIITGIKPSDMLNAEESIPL